MVFTPNTQIDVIDTNPDYPSKTDWRHYVDPNHPFKVLGEGAVGLYGGAYALGKILNALDGTK